MERDTSLKLSKSQERRRISSGGKSRVPRGGFKSTTPTAPGTSEEVEEEEESPAWVSVEEDTQRRRRVGRRRGIGRRRMWRSDAADDADAIGGLGIDSS
jgi:hypothetical protein